MQIPTLHKADIFALASYAAGGGCAGIFAVGAALQPNHAPAWLAGAACCISVAGMVRILANPTPTNNVQVYDRNTGSTVDIKTVTPPSNVPAPAPAYPPTN